MIVGSAPPAKSDWFRIHTRKHSISHSSALQQGSRSFSVIAFLPEQRQLASQHHWLYREELRRQWSDDQVLRLMEDAALFREADVGTDSYPVIRV